jgi:hypothetical protein
MILIEVKKTKVIETFRLKRNQHFQRNDGISAAYCFDDNLQPMKKVLKPRIKMQK